MTQTVLLTGLSFEILGVNPDSLTSGLLRIAQYPRRARFFSRPAFAPKAPQELIVLGFSFADVADGRAVSAPVVSITTERGTDNAPADLLVGAPQVFGSTVVQMVRGGLARTDYRVSAQADTSNGTRHVRVGTLPVRVG